MSKVCIIHVLLSTSFKNFERQVCYVTLYIAIGLGQAYLKYALQYFDLEICAIPNFCYSNEQIVRKVGLCVYLDMIMVFLFYVWMYLFGIFWQKIIFSSKKLVLVYLDNFLKIIKISK